MPGDEKSGDMNDGPFELENQFVMRLPPAPAASLKAVVASGVLNLKDRLTIQLETDMRHGTVRFDGWILPFKIIDLPTIIESLKTLDGKTFYKTADICQLMICKEEVEEDKNDLDGEGRRKDERRDGKDKKFLWAHGVTPPLKNVRKKRFRKTLKKKLVDAPEIEKEVKRLFRMDNEAIHVRYEVVNADEDKIEAKSSNQASPGTSGIVNNNSQSMDIVEHDIFGEVLSSSDEDDTRVQDSDEASRLSAGNAQEVANTSKDTSSLENRYVTEFPRGMLANDGDLMRSASVNLSYDITSESSTAAAAAVAALEEATGTGSLPDRTNSSLLTKLNELGDEIQKLQTRREAQELEIASIENLALKQRFQSDINHLKEQEADKRRQYDEILLILNQ